MVLIGEAKDENGQWKPIEYWTFPWCGNSYFLSPTLASKAIRKTDPKSDAGPFETEVRFKLLNGKAVFHLNPVRSKIDVKQVM